MNIGRRSHEERREQFSAMKLSMSLDYIFGKNTSKAISGMNVEYQYSRRTGRIRYVLAAGSKKVLFSLRPNGSIAPSIQGFRSLLSKRRLSSIRTRPAWILTVVDGVSEVVSAGKTVFCKHVVACSNELRAGQDVAVLNESGDLLAAGRTVLAGPVIKQFKRGVAVKVREGVEHATDES